MITKLLIHKLERIAIDLAAEHGEFTLFGLFLRQGVDARWDLVLSAPWLPRPSRQAIDRVARRLKEKLTPEEMLRVSAIIIAAPAATDFQALDQRLACVELPAELTNFEAFGTQMDHACIISFHPPRSANSRSKPGRVPKVVRR